MEVRVDKVDVQRLQNPYLDEIPQLNASGTEVLTSPYRPHQRSYTTSTSPGLYHTTRSSSYPPLSPSSYPALSLRTANVQGNGCPTSPCESFVSSPLSPLSPVLLQPEVNKAKNACDEDADKTGSPGSKSDDGYFGSSSEVHANESCCKSTSLHNGQGVDSPPSLPPKRPLRASAPAVTSPAAAVPCQSPSPDQLPPVPVNRFFDSTQTESLLLPGYSENFRFFSPPHAGQSVACPDVSTNSTVGRSVPGVSDQASVSRMCSVELDQENLSSDDDITRDSNGCIVVDSDTEEAPPSPGKADSHLRLQLGQILNDPAPLRSAHHDDATPLRSAHHNDATPLRSAHHSCSQHSLTMVTQLDNWSALNTPKPCPAPRDMRSKRACDVMRATSGSDIRRAMAGDVNTRPHSINTTQTGAIEELNMFRRKSSHRRSARASLSTANRRSTELGMNSLEPDVPGWSNSSQPVFCGRQWLFDEIEQALQATDSSRSRGVLLVGGPGTGKTSVIMELIRSSTHCCKYAFADGHKDRQPIVHSHSQPLICERSRNGGLPITQSTASLLSSQSTPAASSYLLQQPVPSTPNRHPPRPSAVLTRLASRVVAYHVCQADNAPTCLVPEFVHSLAAQLARTPSLAAYRRMLQTREELTTMLSVRECVRSPTKALLQGILEPLVTLQQQGRITADVRLVLVDALNEAEFHRPDHGHTITSFLTQHISKFPSWLRLITTVRSSVAELTHFLPLHALRLDDQRSIHDLVSFTQQRLNCSQALRSNTQCNGPASQLQIASALSDRSQSCFLYLVIALELIESGHVVISGSDVTKLPSTLTELFLLLFTHRFTPLRGFEHVSAVLSVCLASLYPLSEPEVYEAVNASRLESFMSEHEFASRLEALLGIVVRRRDGRLMIRHTALREWLVKRDDTSQSQNYVCDTRMGHASLALRLTRMHHYLGPELSLELGHHILKAHIYKNSARQPDVSSRDLQCLWTCLSADSLSAALVEHRNLCSPNVKVSRLILLSGANPNARTDFPQRAPALCVAAMHGYADLCRLLLEFGARPDAASDDGMRPLDYAASTGHVNVIRLLLEHGAQIGMVDKDGRCCIVHAAMKGQLEAVTMLYSSWSTTDTAAASDTAVSRTDALQQAFVAAAASGHIQVCEYLLSKPEVTLDGVDSLFGETAMTSASSSGRSQMIRQLVTWGASLEASNAKTHPPLHLASKHGHCQAVEWLLSSGAGLEERDRHGRTALMIASAEGHLATLDVLLARGASTAAQDQEGLTALCWSCLRGQLTCSKSLLERGADLRHVDMSSRTPLHLAAFSGDAPTIELLLEHGASLDVCDACGARPLERAVSTGSEAAVSVCLRRGARLTAQTWLLSANKPNITMLLLTKLANDANSLYKKNRIPEAAQRYTYALKKLAGALQVQTEAGKKANTSELMDLKLKLLLNLSRCRRRQQDLSAAIDLATTAIELRLHSHEAFYARARAYRHAGMLTDAIKDMIEALKLAPQNQDLQRVLQSIKQEKRMALIPENRQRNNQMPENRQRSSDMQENRQKFGSRRVDQGGRAVVDVKSRANHNTEKRQITDQNTDNYNRLMPHQVKAQHPTVSTDHNNSLNAQNGFIDVRNTEGKCLLSSEPQQKVVFRHVREETAL